MKNPLELTIENLHFSPRISNTLLQEFYWTPKLGRTKRNIYTINDLLQYFPKNILSIRGIGQLSFDEIEVTLEKYLREHDIDRKQFNFFQALEIEHPISLPRQIEENQKLLILKFDLLINSINYIHDKLNLLEKGMSLMERNRK